jgi:DNA-directed RNA polymerase subunit RPC12/RpoP
VHEAHVARAWDLIDTAEAEYLKTIGCPVCKEHALTVVRVTKQHKSKVGALASMLLKGQSVELTKMYKCTACGYDFKHLPEES